MVNVIFHIDCLQVRPNGCYALTSTAASWTCSKYDQTGVIL